MTGQEMRRALLEAVETVSRRDAAQFQTGVIVEHVAQTLNIRNDPGAVQALLTMLYDLFRQGMLAWGYNIDNSGPPYCHLTEQGRLSLRQLSRDPANPDGYMAYVSTRANINAIAVSYLAEALQTYNAGCVKATAVMVGAAAESLALELRDTIVEKLNSLEQHVPRKLSDWRIKIVLDAMQATLEPKHPSMPRELADKYRAFWPAYIQQIRSGRNDAGHPISIDPVTPESVHASLLIFPELGALARELKNWVESSFT